MRKCFVFAASLLAFSFVTTPASAQQWAPLDGRLLVSINGGAQIGSDDASRQSTFDLYGEPATVNVDQEIEGGGLFDISAGYRVRRNLGLGIGYTRMSSSSGGTISGSLPHPLFFDRPRPFSEPLADIEHKEQAVHVQLLYFMPFVENVDFVFSAGPSFFTTTQGFARGVTFSEVPPSFDTVIIESVDRATLEESSVGFNIGADVTYAITPMIGAGAMIRYTRASVDFDLAEGQSASITAGGFQIGAGLRLRF